MSSALELAKKLIARPSVTPDDAGCLDLIGLHLDTMGFTTERMPFGDVDNLWARRGTQEPLFVFAGHTDVVPAGPPAAWESDPFDPQIRNGTLFGRGAADMKSSLAAMVIACEKFIADHPDHDGSIGFLLTSDEEGPAVNGTVKVVEQLESRNEKINWCLVGEPTSDRQIADVIKNGRRGSLSATLTVHGRQGHVAYPHLARNPVHLAVPALAELCAREWDRGNEHFPPTSFQISAIHAGTGANNVIPGTLEVEFNFRFSTASTDSGLRDQVESVLERHGLDFDIHWTLSGQPFLTAAGRLVEAVQQAAEQVTGRRPTLSTSGGTSDGRFIAPTGAQVVELGPCNATIHQVNESVTVADIELLAEIYCCTLKILLTPA